MTTRQQQSKSRATPTTNKRRCIRNSNSGDPAAGKGPQKKIRSNKVVTPTTERASRSKAKDQHYPLPPLPTPSPVANSGVSIDRNRFCFTKNFIDIVSLLLPFSTSKII
jgi:hypothetical protein